MMEMEPKENNRSVFLDNVCGVLILYMIFFHYLGFLGIPRYDNPIVSFFSDTFSFFMSWFFFKNGMFFRQGNTKNTIWTSTKRLLFPFLICMLIGLIIEICKALLNGCSINYNFFRSLVFIVLNLNPLPSVGHIWFLMSLWVVRVCFSIFSKVGFHALSLAVISLLIAMGCNWLAYKSHYVIEFSLSSHFYSFDFPPVLGNIFHGMFCFAMGYFLKEKQYLTSVFICSVFIFLLRYVFVIHSDMRANSTSDPYYVFFVMYGLVGCIVINNISKRFFNHKVSLLTYIGKNSMGFFLGHYTIMYVIFEFFHWHFNEMDVLPWSILVVALFLLIVMVSDFLYRGIVHCLLIVLKK